MDEIDALVAGLTPLQKMFLYHYWAGENRESVVRHVDFEDRGVALSIPSDLLVHSEPRSNIFAALFGLTSLGVEVVERLRHVMPALRAAGATGPTLPSMAAFPEELKQTRLTLLLPTMRLPSLPPYGFLHSALGSPSDAVEGEKKGEGDGE